MFFRVARAMGYGLLVSERTNSKDLAPGLQPELVYAQFP